MSGITYSFTCDACGRFVITMTKAEVDFMLDTPHHESGIECPYCEYFIRYRRKR